MCACAQDGKDKMVEKEKYLKRVFKAYKDNKRRLRELSFDGARGIDYTKTRSAKGAPKGNEQALVSYIDEKRKLEKQVDIVERTYSHYHIKEMAVCDGRAKYIHCRYIKGNKTIKTIMECCISESTSTNWVKDIMETAAAIADIYSLWTE